MIYVIASLEAQAGKRDALLKAFATVGPKVRAEEGCIAYEATVDAHTDIKTQKPVRPNTVTIMEQWDSLEALHAHMQTPHMKEHFAKTAGMVVGRELQILEPA
jgi:quinol monooxygenase YgiN